MGILETRALLNFLLQYFFASLVVTSMMLKCCFFLFQVCTKVTRILDADAVGDVKISCHLFFKVYEKFKYSSSEITIAKLYISNVLLYHRGKFKR